MGIVNEMGLSDASRTQQKYEGLLLIRNRPSFTNFDKRPFYNSAPAAFNTFEA